MAARLVVSGDGLKSRRIKRYEELVFVSGGFFPAQACVQSGSAWRDVSEMRFKGHVCVLRMVFFTWPVLYSILYTR